MFFSCIQLSCFQLQYSSFVGTFCVCSSVKMSLPGGCLAHLSPTLCWGPTRCRYRMYTCLFYICTDLHAVTGQVPKVLSIKVRRVILIGLQAEFGDYEPDQPRPLAYINQLTFAPNQNKEMEEKILELHKSHRSEKTRSCIWKWSGIYSFVLLSTVI